jgi:hypothetical protein
MKPFHMWARGFVLLLLLLVGAVVATAGEAPDLEPNPLTGSVEAVDISYENGNRVRHVVDKGQGADRTSEFISSAAGIAPRIAVNGGGATFVVWWKGGVGQTGQVIYRKRSLASAWSPETLLSNPGENSRNPEIVQCGLSIWVTYEVVTGSATAICVTGISDTPEPFPTRIIIATTTYAGDPDVQVHSGGGEVWVTWVDSATHLAWSLYDRATGLWGAPGYQSYAASDIESARRIIRDFILAQGQ